MDIKDLMEEAGYTPKYCAAKNGGEYFSPCPFCEDGNDRFHVWPKQHDEDTGEYNGGRYWCRRCERSGNAVNFLYFRYGILFDEARRELRLPPKDRVEKLVYQKPPQSPPPLVNDPPALWQEKAGAFVKWCHQQLMENKDALELVRARGFTDESIKRFKIGFNPGEKKFGRVQNFYRKREEWGLERELKSDGKERMLWLPIGITIPTFSPDGRVIRLKVRCTNYEKHLMEYEKAVASGNEPKYKPQKYVEIAGLKSCPSVYGNTSLRCGIVVESELDALLIQQEAGDLVYCVALGGSTKPLDFDTYQLLSQTPLILFCPDFDKAGKVAWEKWKTTFPNIHVILTMEGKGAGDDYLAGEDLREWISENISEIQKKMENEDER